MQTARANSVSSQATLQGAKHHIIGANTKFAAYLQSCNGEWEWECCQRLLVVPVRADSVMYYLWPHMLAL